jgi:coenzyme F420 hydrogenase subunit beta
LKDRPASLPEGHLSVSRQGLEGDSPESGSPLPDANRLPHRPQYVADNPHVVNQIVERDLCVRCGACEPACPVDIIRFDEKRFPYITKEDDCIRNCTRCIKVCPGEEVDFSLFDRKMFGVSPHPQSVTGIVNRAMVSYSTNETIRKTSTSGGFVTQFLVYLLEKGIIDGALVLGVTDEGGRGYEDKPFIARTADDLRRSSGSKYRVVPHLLPLGEMEKIEGNYAVVALPCYAHALRKYQQVSPQLRKRLKLIIGLYCNVTLEPHLFDEVCEFHGVDKKDVLDLQFRAGKWPGGIHAKLRSGETVKVLKLEEMKDEFNLLKQFYTPLRCNMCTDFSVEYADLAAGDPWLRGPDGKYLFTGGWTTVITRTAYGDRLIDAAVADGYLHTEEIPLSTFMMNFEKAARYKRDFVPAHLRIRKFLGLPIPDYHRELPRPTTGEYLRALRGMVLGYVFRSKTLRRIGIRLAQTRPALAYYRWNRKRKERRFKDLFAAQERFVASIVPPENRATRETSGFEERYEDL